MTDRSDDIIDEMIKDGLIIEHQDGTLELTDKGIEVAEAFRARLEGKLQ
jgi:predicted transcriptional regulator